MEFGVWGLGFEGCDLGFGVHRALSVAVRGLGSGFHLTECIYRLVGESHPAQKIVNLLFTITG